MIELRPGRWLVAIALALAVVVLATELRSSERLFVGLAKAAATAAGSIGLGGVALRLWGGASIAEAQLPGGVGVVFEKSDRDIARVKRELVALDDETSRRLLLLERAVFGQNGSGDVNDGG